MKLSSITLAITATLAVSVVAAPGPLHARTLEQVNPFERDVDVYPRFIVVNPVSIAHRSASVALESAIKANREAAYHTKNAGQDIRSLGHTKEAEELEELNKQHIKAAREGKRTDLLNKVDDHMTRAQTSKDEAKEAIELALKKKSYVYPGYAFRG